MRLPDLLQWQCVSHRTLPASAAARSAKLLGERLPAVESASREVGAAGFSDAQLAMLDALRATTTEPVRLVRSPIEAAEHEEGICEWLDAHGTDPSAAEGASQISKLVDAVRSLTRVDHAAVAAPVNLNDALMRVLDVLRTKAQSKSVSVSLSVEPSLTTVRGFSGELDHIWANLIDNAIDAVPASGRVDVTAMRDGRSAIVRVIDDGPGIPANVRDRIFDPFFTTKPVGSGTGLGLDIVRRLVRHNDGTIKVFSEPGRTEFQVTLPLIEIRETGATP